MLCQPGAEPLPAGHMIGSHAVVQSLQLSTSDTSDLLEWIANLRWFDAEEATGGLVVGESRSGYSEAVTVPGQRWPTAPLLEACELASGALDRLGVRHEGGFEWALSVLVMTPGAELLPHRDAAERSGAFAFYLDGCTCGAGELILYGCPEVERIPYQPGLLVTLRPGVLHRVAPTCEHRNRVSISGFRVPPTAPHI